MSAEASIAGKVLKDDMTKPGFWLAQALYGFKGSKHSFVAYNFITENHATNTATIRGVVILGWMAGARVTGEYTVGIRAPSRRRGTCSGACVSRARSTSSSGGARRRLDVRPARASWAERAARRRPHRDCIIGDPKHDEPPFVRLVI